MSREVVVDGAAGQTSVAEVAGAEEETLEEDVVGVAETDIELTTHVMGREGARTHPDGGWRSGPRS